MLRNNFEEGRLVSNEHFLENRKEFAAKVGSPELYDFIDHFSLYAGAHTIANKLFTYEMLKKTIGIPGDLAEFGCWKGSNLMFLAKIISLLEPHSPKKVLGFDNFSGLPKPSKEDGTLAIAQTGNYCGNEEVLKDAISLFDLDKKVKLINGDALKTIPSFNQSNKETVLSFVYLDFDLYEPTKVALNFIDESLSLGGVIVFDQACIPEWPGETLAMKEYLKTSKHDFEMLSNNISRQPTVALKRIK